MLPVGPASMVPAGVADLCLKGGKQRNNTSSSRTMPCSGTACQAAVQPAVGQHQFQTSSQITHHTTIPTSDLNKPAVRVGLTADT